MSKRFALLISAAVLSFAAVAPAPLYAQMAEKTVTVGGAPMYPSKNIVQNAVNSKDHTTLVAAVKAAGLVPTLEGRGPFTVFAPTNEAFAALPTGTVANLLKPENKAELTKILTYHVVLGRYDAHLVLLEDSRHGEDVGVEVVQESGIIFLREMNIGEKAIDDGDAGREKLRLFGGVEGIGKMLFEK